MFINPFWFVVGYIFLRWLFVRAPRGLYHRLNRRAHDHWKVKHEFRMAWAEHRRKCRDCDTPTERGVRPERRRKRCEIHRAEVLARVEDSLLASGAIRHGLPREPDEITVAPGRAIVRAIVTYGKGQS